MTSKSIFTIWAAFIFAVPFCPPASAEEPGSLVDGNSDYSFNFAGPQVDDMQLEKTHGKGEAAVKLAPLAVILWDEVGRKGRGGGSSDSNLPGSSYPVTITFNGK